MICMYVSNTHNLYLQQVTNNKHHIFRKFGTMTNDRRLLYDVYICMYVTFDFYIIFN